MTGSPSNSRPKLLSTALKERAGALWAPAESFVPAFCGQAFDAFCAGGTGLRALAGHMLAFTARLDVDEETDRRFVEGAGALLGLLLIDHVTDGAYVTQGQRHLVRLGPYGFFDPFAAVDHALDAPNLRVELTRQVALAEAEAKATGPLSRLVARLVAALASERPDLSLASQFECTLSLQTAAGERFELDLTRAVESTRDVPETSLDHTVRKLLSLLPGAPQADTVGFDDVRHRLFPRVARVDDLAALNARSQSPLFTSPLVSDLVVALVIEDTSRARYVREEELVGWGVDAAQALQCAKENLAEASARTRLTREDTDDGPIFMLRSGDGRDSARLLLDTLHGPLSERVGPHPVIAVPHRDALLACDGRVDALVDRLRARAQADAARAPHRVSDGLFMLETGTLRMRLED